MISICIPVYNHDVRPLVNDLHKQASALKGAFEIILIDDGSKHFKKTNQTLNDKAEIIELPENVGRAKIRNLFLKHVKKDFLLFIDCDSKIVNNNYLQQYMTAIHPETQVICGGNIYSKKKPPRNKRLRWRYGNKIESQNAKERDKQPDKSFMTNNFLIRKELFSAIQFDERIKKYGHEDTLFGYQLKKDRVLVNHIDNAVLNDELDNNREFLRKTRDGIENLISIVDYVKQDTEFTEDVSILQYYYKTRAWHRIFRFLFFSTKPLIFFLLVNGFANMNLFGFYKLGILLQIKKNHKKQKSFSTK